MYSYKKLINIEGIDGSGKETQSKELKSRLEKLGYDVVIYSFPNYSDNNIGSIGVQKMLSGELGEDIVNNPYATSILFALDRYLSIDKLLKDSEDKIVIFDRYVESNIMYQTRNVSNYIEVAEWLYDFEYNKLNLPKPDLTILIDLDVSTSERLREGRDYKSGMSRDLYEEDRSILEKSRERSLQLYKHFGWKKVDMREDSSIKEISDSIWKEVKKIL